MKQNLSMGVNFHLFVWIFLQQRFWALLLVDFEEQVWLNCVLWFLSFSTAEIKKRGSVLVDSSLSEVIDVNEDPVRFFFLFQFPFSTSCSFLFPFTPGDCSYFWKKNSTNQILVTCIGLNGWLFPSSLTELLFCWHFWRATWSHLPASNFFIFFCFTHVSVRSFLDMLIRKKEIEKRRSSFRARSWRPARSFLKIIDRVTEIWLEEGMLQRSNKS